jgi:hypothetical protein
MELPFIGIKKVSGNDEENGGSQGDVFVLIGYLCVLTIFVIDSDSEVVEGDTTVQSRYCTTVAFNWNLSGRCRKTTQTHNNTAYSFRNHPLWLFDIPPPRLHKRCQLRTLHDAMARRPTDAQLERLSLRSPFPSLRSTSYPHRRV